MPTLQVKVWPSWSTGPSTSRLNTSSLPQASSSQLGSSTTQHQSLVGLVFKDFLVKKKTFSEFTRISEYKHSPNQPAGVRDLPGTIIYRVNLTNRLSCSYTDLTIFQEYSTDEGDPYYPVPNPRNQELYAKYQSLAAQVSLAFFSNWELRTDELNLNFRSPALRLWEGWPAISTSTWTRRYSMLSNCLTILWRRRKLKRNDISFVHESIKVDTENKYYIGWNVRQKL